MTAQPRSPSPPGLIASSRASTSGSGRAAWAATADGRLLLATGGEDHAARVWDPATGEQVAVLAHPDEVLAVAFTPAAPGAEADLLLATGSQDSRVRVYPVRLRSQPPPAAEAAPARAGSREALDAAVAATSATGGWRKCASSGA